MNKVNDIVIYIGVDKLLHFFVSIIIFTYLAKWTGNIELSIILTFAIGILKEFYDIFFKGKVELKDIVANTCGIIVGIGLWIL